MGRRRVKHELISSESTRKVTFKKRKVGLLKKLKELSTLCGVIGSAIIYSGYDVEPEVWPSSSEAIYILEKLKNLPKKTQGKYMMNPDAFLEKNIHKLSRKLEKQRKINRRLKLELVFAKFISGKNICNFSSFKNSKDVSNLLKEEIEFINHKIDELQNYA